MYSELQRQAIVEAVIKHPELSHAQIAQQFQVGRIAVIAFCNKAGIKRSRGAGSYAYQCAIAKKNSFSPKSNCS